MGISSSYKSPKTVLVINKPSNAKLKVSIRLALNLNMTWKFVEKYLALFIMENRKAIDLLTLRSVI